VKRISVGIALSATALGAIACGDKGNGPLDGVEAIVFVSRQPREDGMGDIFQYQSYVAGAKLLKLSPPTADGEVTEICCSNLSDPAYANVDIIDFDLNFAADAIVLSARLSADQHYGLFVLDIASGNIEQLPTDPNFDYVYPTFLPDGGVLFRPTRSSRKAPRSSRTSTSAARRCSSVGSTPMGRTTSCSPATCLTASPRRSPMTAPWS
jgi:hypothetical protein